MVKELDYYLNLDYDIVVSKIPKDEGGGYFAYYDDYKGIMGDGLTKEEAIEDVKKAFKAFLEVALLNKDTIKEPKTKLSKSIRLHITLPKELVKQIDEIAAQRHLNRSQFLAEAAKSYI